MDVALKSEPIVKCEVADSDFASAVHNSYREFKTEDTSVLHINESAATYSGFSEAYNIKTEASHQEIGIQGNGDIELQLLHEEIDIKDEVISPTTTEDLVDESAATCGGFSEVCNIKFETPHQEFGIEGNGDIKLQLLHEEIDIKDEIISSTAREDFVDESAATCGGFSEVCNIKFETPHQEFGMEGNGDIKLQLLHEEIDIKDEIISSITREDLPQRQLTEFHSELQKSPVCLVCNESFSEVSTLRSHSCRGRSENAFECKTCNKKFSRLSNLKNHMLIHSGEKPFDCKICNKKFKVSSDLNRHMRFHSGEKPFECKLCNKKFKVSSDLNRHMRIHTKEKPFHCKICNKTFSESSALKSHIRFHTGEKPFDCNVCKKKFTTSSNLNRHMKIH